MLVSRTNKKKNNEYNGHWYLLYVATPISLFILCNFIETEVVFDLSVWKPHLMHTNETLFVFLFVLTTTTTWNASNILL